MLLARRWAGCFDLGRYPTGELVDREVVAAWWLEVEGVLLLELSELLWGHVDVDRPVLLPQVRVVMTPVPDPYLLVTDEVGQLPSPTDAGGLDELGQVHVLDFFADFGMHLID